MMYICTILAILVCFESLCYWFWRILSKILH